MSVVSIRRKRSPPESILLELVRSRSVIGELHCVYSNDSAYIVDVSVDEEHQGHGFGSCLMQELESIVASMGICKIELEDCLDDGQRTFYTRLGYSYVEESDNAMIKTLM